jgi:DNA-binding transcriptional MerR regulator
MYKVKEVAALSGVSVRTLHYYDEIGLLKPESISPAGYRLYSDENLQRLQQILFFKEMGFELLEIKNILDHPGFERTRALELHREVLMAKKRRLEEMIRTVDKTLESLKGGIPMEQRELFEGFDMSEIEKYQTQYAEEARERWGKEIVDESLKRTSRYTASDWAAIMARQNEIYHKVIAGMDKGPADPQVQQAVAELRQHITDNFYDCTLEIFRGLGDLYVSDPRFTANIDKYKEGLASFLREAMHIYCDRAQQ